jgi:hypothetical protein
VKNVDVRRSLSNMRVNVLDTIQEHFNDENIPFDRNDFVEKSEPYLTHLVEIAHFESSDVIDLIVTDQEIA